MSRPRCAMTLMELMAMLAIAGLVVGGVMTVFRPLQRMAGVDTARGVRAELACSQLRRDLVGSVITTTTDTLHIRHGTQKIVWHLADGELLRGERPMLAATRFAPALVDGWLVVAITPLGLPERRIEALP